MIAWLVSSALMRSPLGAFLARFWKPLGIALALIAGFLWHQHHAHKMIADAESRGEQRGEARAYASITKQATDLAEKADKIAKDLRTKTDANARDIADDSDALRLRGPGKASCSGPAPAATGGREQAGRPVDGGLPDLSGEQREPLVGLPNGEVDDFAEVCDLNRNEVLAWRTWYGRLTSSWGAGNGGSSAVVGSAATHVAKDD